MAAQKLVKYPDTALRVPVQSVSWPMDQIIWQHIADLQDTLLIEKNGVAIASNQIEPRLGSNHHIFVVDDNTAKRLGEKIFINTLWEPQVNSGMISQPEGCLSFPGMTFDVLRHKSIKIKFQNILGNIVEMNLEGFDARMVQHECDHLAGKLFIEYIDKKKQIEVRNEVIRRRKSGRW
jgi:peptide deformylase